MADQTWGNPTGGSWSENEDWSPDGTPGIGDNAVLPSLTQFVQGQPAPDPYVVVISGHTTQTPGLVTFGGTATGAMRPDGSQASTTTIAVQDGSALTVNANMTVASFGETGEVDLSGASTLTVGLSSEQTPSAVTVRFADDTANVLGLYGTGPIDRFSPYAPDDFLGTIAGFSTNDLILLTYPKLASDTLSYGNGVLTVTTTIPNYEQNLPTDPPTIVEPGAILNFAGTYTAANFRLVTAVDAYGDPVEAIAFVPQTIIGAAGGHVVRQGSSGDDTIIAYGASNVIDTNGGSDTVDAGSGGYNQVNAGTPGDGEGGYSDTITLGGSYNQVTGGDANFTITGGTGGSRVILGSGADQVTLGGGNNTVDAGLGADTINAGGGSSRVLIAGNGASYSDTVTFTGQSDRLDVQTNAQSPATGTLTVHGGAGYGVFNLEQATVDFTATGVGNRISLAGSSGTDTIAPGSGGDSVTLQPSATGLPGDFVIELAGMGNWVQGAGGSVDVSGGSGQGVFNLGASDALAGAGAVTIATDGLYNSFALSSVNTNTITAGSGSDAVTISDPVASPFNPAALQSSAIRLVGLHNNVTVGNASVSVIGGAGSGTFALGDGNDTVTTDGLGNTITLGAGQDYVIAGSGHDVVTLNGTDAALQLVGMGNFVYLNDGSSGSIDGIAPGLRITVGPQAGNEVIDGFASDTGALIHLLGGIGPVHYATSAQVIAALTPDGHGGTLLPLGAGSIDFTGVAASALHQQMFIIG